ncbi:uncharacterized protein LOC114353001 isoform X2 [Ostrinia furnacalis]|uniref:uncharacterized protein LOC114353001 isoform X2 n=1 Tax=Ostrinia furnacalis TaxID=93504 RepID=UPI00103A5FBA|nr:uncharacterized protein LOC114353001 isoform X2 [Ostrinia furnacalis]
MNAARPLHSCVYHRAHISRGRCHDNTRRHAVRAILTSTMYMTRINPWARPDVGRSGEHVKAAPVFNQRSVRMRWDRPANPMRASMTFRLRKGGGRSFQHRVAANLKEPRNAMERCLGVAKMCVQALLVRPSLFLAQSSFSYRYLGLCVVMIPNIIVARCSLLRAAIFIMFAALRNGVTCARGGTVKQKRAQAFCALCTSLSDLAMRQGPYTVSQ